MDILTKVYKYDLFNLTSVGLHSLLTILTIYPIVLRPIYTLSVWLQNSKINETERVWNFYVFCY